MRKKLDPADRLIVAADNVDVMELATRLQGTGVYIKVNSALRERGYPLILQLHELGLRVFADLKLNDIPETLATDGHLLATVAPELVTVMCSAGITAMKSLKAMLPNTELLGVTVLTSMSDSDSLELYGCTVAGAVMRLALMARAAGIAGLISSAREAPRLREALGDELTINTPAIRPVWAKVAGDDQNAARVVTPAEAIRLGADRIVVGRPIVRAADMRDAVLRTLDELANWEVQ